MADFGMKPDIALGVKGPTPIPLSDLVTMARGLQAYQQAERMNPVEFEKAQAERDVAVQTVKPRVSKALTEADQAIFGAQAKVLSHTRSEIAQLITKKDLTFDDVQKAVERTVEHTQASPEIKRRAIEQTMADFNPNASEYELRQALAGALVKTVSQENQLSSRLPKPETVETGGAKFPVATGNELVTGVKPGTQVGIGYQLTPAPQFLTDETGLYRERGGGPPGVLMPAPGAGVPGQPAAPVAAPASAAPAAAQVSRAAAPAMTSQTQVGQPGPLAIAPGESVEAYRARVAELGKLPSVAAEALNPKNVESIPNMEYTNNRIIKLLENPKLDIGPIANAIANKTGGIGLNSDQQIIKKYLEQRIRQEGSRSNQDQESQRAAFGSFANDKEALREIIYNDKTRLASDRLFNEGVRRAMGNPNKPNLGAVNVFRDKFNELAGDRDLMTYIGIVGNKPIDQLTATDKNYLRKVFGGRGDMGAVFDELETKQKALMKLVKG